MAACDVVQARSIARWSSDSRAGGIDRRSRRHAEHLTKRDGSSEQSRPERRGFCMTRREVMGRPASRCHRRAALPVVGTRALYSFTLRANGRADELAVPAGTALRLVCCAPVRSTPGPLATPDAGPLNSRTLSVKGCVSSKDWNRLRQCIDVCGTEDCETLLMCV